MKSMKNIVRMIAALLVAVMMLSTAAFAEEWTDEACEPAEEMMAAETASEEETFEETDWDDMEAADIAEADDMAVADEEAEGDGSEDEALIAEDEEIIVVNKEDEETTENESEDGEAAEGNADNSGMDMGMDLLAAFDEADMPEIEEEAEEVDRTEMMATLIDDTIAANQNEGIYGALDATFEALADNAMALSNPVTGVIEVKGDEIIDMTVSALRDNFDGSTEKLMGAVGAAAVRADANGYIQALGGDRTLVCMAANEGTAEENVDSMKDLIKDTLEAGIDVLGDVHPAFKFAAPAIKMMLGAMLDEDEKDPNTVIREQLEHLDAKLDDIESNMKDHMENVVVLADLGSKTGSVAQYAETLRIRLGNIKSNSKLSDAEKVSQIASLYDTAIVTDLENAMVGAINTFRGNTNVTLGNLSIFDASYNRACEDVMFSGEALDATAPYIARQLAYYAEGYAVLGQVCDAYEAVYGATSLNETRKTMKANLTGSENPFKLSRNYFDTYRFTFVNKSNTTNIKLSPCIRTHVELGDMLRDGKYGLKPTPDFMKNNPLSADQVKAIAKYAADKDMTVFDYLVNRVKFSPYVYGWNGEKLVPFSVDLNTLSEYIRDMVNPKYIFLATGAQTYRVQEVNMAYAQSLRWANINVINATKKGATDEQFKFWSNDTVPLATVMFFEKG